LIMQPSEHPFLGSRMVILDEDLWNAKLFKIPLLIGLHEEASGIFKNSRLDYNDIRNLKPFKAEWHS